MIKKLKELEYRLLDAWNAECIANAQYRAKHADAPDFDEQCQERAQRELLLQAARIQVENAIEAVGAIENYDNKLSELVGQLDACGGQNCLPALVVKHWGERVVNDEEYHDNLREGFEKNRRFVLRVCATEEYVEKCFESRAEAVAAAVIALKADIYNVAVYEIKEANGYQSITDWFDDNLSFHMTDHGCGPHQPVIIVP